MRTLILSLFALLISTSALSASEIDPADARPTEVVPTVVEQPAPDAVARVQLKEVSMENRAAADDAVSAQPRRGSFWWLVGVIVVAGVILAVVL